MLTQGAVGNGNLSPNPLFNAGRVEEVPAVAYAAQGLSGLEVIEAYAAGFLLLYEVNLDCEALNDQITLMLLLDLLQSFPNQLLEEGEAPDNQLLPLHVDVFVRGVFKGVLQLPLEHLRRRSHFQDDDPLPSILNEHRRWHPVLFLTLSLPLNLLGGWGPPPPSPPGGQLPHDNQEHPKAYHGAHDAQDDPLGGCEPLLLTSCRSIHFKP